MTDIYEPYVPFRHAMTMQIRKHRKRSDSFGNASHTNAPCLYHVSSLNDPLGLDLSDSEKQTTDDVKKRDDAKSQSDTETATPLSLSVTTELDTGNNNTRKRSHHRSSDIARHSPLTAKRARRSVSSRTRTRSKSTSREPSVPTTDDELVTQSRSSYSSRRFVVNICTWSFMYDCPIYVALL